MKATTVAPVKLVPVRVTLVPTGPLVGAKLVMVGGLAFDTVTVTVFEVHCWLRLSRATAASVCVPLPVVALFQEME